MYVTRNETRDVSKIDALFLFIILFVIDIYKNSRTANVVVLTVYDRTSLFLITFNFHLLEIRHQQQFYLG